MTTRSIALMVPELPTAVCQCPASNMRLTGRSSTRPASTARSMASRLILPSAKKRRLMLTQPMNRLSRSVASSPSPRITSVLPPPMSTTSRVFVAGGQPVRHPEIDQACLFAATDDLDRVPERLFRRAQKGTVVADLAHGVGADRAHRIVRQGMQRWPICDRLSSARARASSLRLLSGMSPPPRRTASRRRSSTTSCSFSRLPRSCGNCWSRGRPRRRSPGVWIQLRLAHAVGALCEVMRQCYPHRGKASGSKAAILSPDCYILPACMKVIVQARTRRPDGAIWVFCRQESHPDRIRANHHFCILISLLCMRRAVACRYRLRTGQSAAAAGRAAGTASRPELGAAAKRMRAISTSSRTGQDRAGPFGTRQRPGQRVSAVKHPRPGRWRPVIRIARCWKTSAWAMRCGVRHDGLMSAIYHRLTFLDFESDRLGWRSASVHGCFCSGARISVELCRSPPAAALFRTPVDCLGQAMTP